MPDQWRADVANANGRLNQGLLHIPPIEFVKEIFVLRLDKIDVLNPKGQLSAHEVWPFVISSLSVQGTPGPYWFLVRSTPDLGQLRALIEKAAELGSGYLKRNTQEVLNGIEAIRRGKPVASTVKGIRDLSALSKASKGTGSAWPKLQDDSTGRIARCPKPCWPRSRRSSERRPPSSNAPHDRRSEISRQGRGTHLLGEGLGGIGVRAGSSPRTSSPDTVPGVAGCSHGSKEGDTTH